MSRFNLKSSEAEKLFDLLVEEQITTLDSSVFSALSADEQITNLLQIIRDSVDRHEMLPFLLNVSDEKLIEIQGNINIKNIPNLTKIQTTNLRGYLEDDDDLSNEELQSIADKLALGKNVRAITNIKETKSKSDTLLKLIGKSPPEEPIIDQFIGRLDGDEKKAFDSLVLNKGLKKFNQDGQIVMPGRTRGALKSFLDGTKPKPLQATFKSIHDTIGISATGLDDGEKAVLLKMINQGIIIGGGAVKLEGRGAKKYIQMGAIPHMTNSFGYICPHSSRQSMHVY